MIINDKIIRRLSIEERLKLVVGSNLYVNNTFSYYDFPIFELVKNPLAVGKSVSSINYPSEKGVLSTWNSELFSLYGKILGNENVNVSPNLFFKEDGNSELCVNKYLYANFLSNYVEGIGKTKSKFILELNDQQNDANAELPTDVVLKKEITNFILVSTVEQAISLIRDKSYKGNLYANAKNIDELAQYINLGINLVYYEGENYDSLIEAAAERTRSYDEYQAMIKNGQISEKDLEDKISIGNVISPYILANACDRMIEFLKEVEIFRNKEVTKEETIENRDQILYQIAYESVVLLKNENNTLPLDHTRKVALLGDCVKNTDYYEESAVNTISSLESIFNEAEKSELLNCVGYAHGYHKGTPTKESLVKVGLELVKKSNVGVIFLCADEKLGRIPQEQIEFFKACLEETRKPIVAVVFADCKIDLSEINAAQSILLASRLQEGHAKAIVDILVGNVNPSGKLVQDYKKVINDEQEEKEVYNYPFGYGLSYTEFAYSNLEIKENGVYLTLTNTGEYAGIETVQLYIKKDKNNSIFNDGLLRGFKKVFVEKGDAVKVFIPFDENTFRYYDEKEKCYGVEGGEYLLSVGSSKEQVRLKGTIKLTKCLDEKYGFKNEDKEEISLENVNNFMSKPTKKDNFKLKLVISILLMVYFTISLLILVISELNGYSDPTKITFGIICLVLVNVVLGLFIFISYKKRVVTPEFNPNETLTLLMDDIKEYKVSSRRLYNVDIEVDDVSEEKKEVINENNEQESEQTEDLETYDNEKEEEEVVDISDANLTEEDIKLHEEEQIRLMEEQNHAEIAEFNDEDDDTTYDDQTSIHGLCDRLVEYSKNKGIIIELSSCRNLISALCSSHMVVLNSKVKELVNPFLEILNSYFGNRGHISVGDSSWNSVFFLLWKKDENGNYVKTDFVNDIHNSSKYKNMLNLTFITNVDHTNFEKYFGAIIDFASKPSYVHKLQLNQKQEIKIQPNTRFVVVPNGEDFLDNVSNKVLDSIAYVDIFLRKADSVKEEVEAPSIVSYAHLEENIASAKNTYFIKEESWKKIDQLVESIKELDDFSLGNKNVISMENYSSVIMECGADESDALEAILLSKVVPLIKGLKSYKLDGGEKTYIKLIEKVFGKENSSKVTKALKKVVPVVE